MFGAVGDSRGAGRPLKSNTSKIRTDSSVRQGCVLCELFNNARAQAFFGFPQGAGCSSAKAFRIRLRLREIHYDGQRNNNYLRWYSYRCEWE
jgi:hypothetical protein